MTAMKAMIAGAAVLLALATCQGQPAAGGKFYVLTNVTFPVDGEQRTILFCSVHDTADAAISKHRGENIHLAVHGVPFQPAERPDTAKPGDRYWLVWIGKPDGRNDEMYVRGFPSWAAFTDFHRREAALAGYQFRHAMVGIEVALPKR